MVVALMEWGAEGKRSLGGLWVVGSAHYRRWHLLDGDAIVEAIFTLCLGCRHVGVIGYPGRC
jgi:hypothetical protein